MEVSRLGPKHEKYWHGIPNPWDAYLSQKIGKYILIHYYNLPNVNVSNRPHIFVFVLIDCNYKVTTVQCCNILQLETRCNDLETY